MPQKKEKARRALDFFSPPFFFYFGKGFKAAVEGRKQDRKHRDNQAK